MFWSKQERCVHECLSPLNTQVQYGIIPHLRMSQHLQITFKPTPSLTFTVAKFVQPIINRNGPKPPPPSCGETRWSCPKKPCCLHGQNWGHSYARAARLGISGACRFLKASLDILLLIKAVSECVRYADQIRSM